MSRKGQPSSLKHLLATGSASSFAEYADLSDEVEAIWLAANHTLHCGPWPGTIASPASDPVGRQLVIF